MSTKRERPNMIPVGHIEIESDSEESALCFLAECLGIERSRVTRSEIDRPGRQSCYVYRFYIRDLRPIKGG